MKRRLVRVGYRRTLVAADWDALTARQLLHLARLVQSGLPKDAVELAFGLGLLGRRIVRYQERDGEPGALTRSRWGLLGWMDVFALQNARALAAFVTADTNDTMSLRTRNPYPRRGSLLGWEDNLADVRLDELLLAMDQHQALARTPAGDPQARADALYALLGTVWRRNKRGEREPLEVASGSERTRRARHAFGPAHAQVALWYVEGTLAMVAKRFPRLFGSGDEETGAEPSSGSQAVGLVYALARGHLEHIPRIRQAWALDALLMLDALAVQAQQSAHARPTAGL